MKKKSSIHKINRLLLIAGAVVLFIVMVVPMWRIDLQAPQYPEGLQLFIYPNRLAGSVDIVNGLNHYIGMKPLRTENFIEFTLLRPIIFGFAFLLLLTAFINKRGMLNTVFVLFVLFGIIAMIDFWKWEYNYGHNLNPDAPIIVPGMAYQPPLIGFKQLLNFGAYSIPAIGGLLFAGVGLMLLVMTVVEYRLHKKVASMSRMAVAAILAPLLFFVASCNTEPKPITVGKDVCSYCKMPVSDNRFGAEVITTKGKIYKFDDSHCILSFLHDAKFQSEKNYAIYFVDFSGDHSLIPVSKSLFLKSEALRSPMNGNIAAFNNADSLQMAFDKYAGGKLNWNEVYKP